MFIMTTWTGLLFFLCSILSPALCCDWFSRYSHQSNISLTLIRLMGGPMTDEESPVSFPYKLYRRIRRAEVETQLVFIRESLKQIFELYHYGNLSSVNWDTSKTHHFLQSIHRQKDDVSTCMLSTKTANCRLKNYYRRLAKKTLYRTGFSTASWELIRKVTEQHLDQLDLLANSIRALAAASRRRSGPRPQKD
ncbi:interferon phi 1 [Channa argus]